MAHSAERRRPLRARALKRLAAVVAASALVGAGCGDSELAVEGGTQASEQSARPLYGHGDAIDGQSRLALVGGEGMRLREAEEGEAVCSYLLDQEGTTILLWPPGYQVEGNDDDQQVYGPDGKAVGPADGAVRASGAISTDAALLGNPCGLTPQRAMLLQADIQIQ